MGRDGVRGGWEGVESCEGAGERERERGRNGDIVNNCSRRIVLIFYRAIVTVVLLFASRPWHGYGLAWHGISQQRATTLGRTQYDYADSSRRDTAYFNYHQ